jgi:hypothetical protein
LDAIGNAQGLVNQRNCPKQWVGFAIELETELQEATFEIERLRKANLQLQEGAEQQKQRIKMLEEAGDALANTQTYDLLETVNWRKAKEAKP